MCFGFVLLVMGWGWEILKGGFEVCYDMCEDGRSKVCRGIVNGGMVVWEEMMNVV